MSDVAIRVENLSKLYRLGAARGPYKTLRESIMTAASAPFRRLTGRNGSANGNADRDLWALKDVSFEVKQGEVVGIIGRNGAGKSTLLKILSRITEPTSGKIEIHGRVGSLLEVGTGFHPELTGRENIFLNGAILGMKRAEITRKFDEIVAFAETEKFLDTQVKFYSSGMYMRLAFAVAAHLEPEILVVDEVLAVGDAQFQKKCLGKMGEVASQGKTVLVVSHNMAVIQSLCSTAILLKQGQIVERGASDVVTSTYLTGGNTEAPSASVETQTHSKRLPRMKPLLKIVSIHGEDRTLKADFVMGEPIVLRIVYDASDTNTTLAGAGFILETENGVRVGGFNSYMATMPPHRLPVKGSLDFCIRKPCLTPGNYCFTVSLGSHQGVLEDKIERLITFHVHATDLYHTGYVLTKEDGVVALECELISA